MHEKLSSIVAFLTEIEKLKLVYRKAYVSDLADETPLNTVGTWQLACSLSLMSSI